LIDGFQRLSDRSVYLRFFSPKHQLSDEDLSFLEELDGENRYGIVAAKRLADETEGEGVGVARFVRVSSDPSIAEPAVIVSDDFQGQGVGRILCDRLAEAALERGVRWFRCYVLSENRRVLRMLKSEFPEIHLCSHGEIVVAEMSLLSKNDVETEESRLPSRA
jgi:GNAT superfamily N-acetyltransferase